MAVGGSLKGVEPLFLDRRQFGRVELPFVADTPLTATGLDSLLKLLIVLHTENPAVTMHLELGICHQQGKGWPLVRLFQCQLLVPSVDLKDWSLLKYVQSL